MQIKTPHEWQWLLNCCNAEGVDAHTAHTTGTPLEKFSVPEKLGYRKAQNCY